MRRVLGYVDGKPIWSENQPAYGGSIRWGGTIVVGESSRPPRDRAAEAQRRYKNGLRGEHLDQQRSAQSAEFVASKEDAA